MTLLSLMTLMLTLLRAALLMAGLTLPEQPATDKPAAPAKAPAATPAPAQPVTPAPAPAATAQFKDAEALLDALERADAGLTSLRADVRYDKIFEDQGDRQTRLGRLMFRAQPPAAEGQPPRRSFALLIDELWLGTRRDQKLQMIIFNGEWFVEKIPAEKRFVKRRIARPGDSFDPFKVGEGQFPLPIGQKKADILSRFDATLLPAEAELEGEDDKETAELRAFVANTYQLRLTIRPELRQSAEMREIRLWYRTQTSADGTTLLLPRMARTTHRGGTLSIVRMLNVTLNMPFDSDPFDVSNPPEDWDLTIQDELAP